MIARIGWIAWLAATGAAFATETPLAQQQARTSPAWITDGVMYQIQPRAFTPEGTLKAAQARLPKLAELGVTILYLCPVFVADDDTNPAFWSARQKRSGTNNPRNPYRIKDFYHVDPEYGTDQDLKDFIAAAHTYQLRVMLDMVYLHCGPTAVFLKDHPDFVKRDKEGQVIHAAWAFPELNYTHPGLREYLWKNMEYWVLDFDADGFRCDVGDGIPLDFWETARSRLEAIRPDIGMLSEGLRKTDQLKAFDLDYGWWGSDWENAARMRKTWESMRDERPRGGAKFIRFIDNHDFSNDAYQNRLEKRWGADRVEAALAATFTLDGVPFIYNGQEVADAARHSIFGRMPIDWSNANTDSGHARFVFCQKLCALRKSEAALRKGDLTWLENDQPEAIFSFARVFGSERIVSLVNLTDKPMTVRVSGADADQTLLERGVTGESANGLNVAPHGLWIGKTEISASGNLKGNHEDLKK